MKVSTGLRVAVLALSGLISFALSQYVLREATPEISESGAGVNIHSKSELLQLLPGLGDVAGLAGTSETSWMDVFGDSSLYDCIPSLNESAVDVAPPSIETIFTMEQRSVVSVEFGRIAPSDVQKAQDSLREPKELCSERGSRFGEYGTEGLWTFTRHSSPPLGNASLAYEYSYRPDSEGVESSAGRVVYAISNGWGITAVTDEASGEALNLLLPRILAGLDRAVGTKFLR
ncbi:hypothetical protein ACFQVD_36415 [Streptosporangium amethystogenes subsp. fukuiense]|uniref:Secreted protein n=1 Tax=Streptosporangium amethystogenes subsp. fukuiense TaxID=698418 RepID=A0ABW2TAV8_9ACTN